MNDREDSGKKKDDQQQSQMQWMYNRNKIDNDDLLLGRRKFTEGDLKQNYNKSKDEKIHQQAKVEMWIKMHEDPLYQICNEEQNARRKILENPLKLKEIRAKLKENSNSDEKPTSESDELLAKYLEIIKQKAELKKINSTKNLSHKKDTNSQTVKKMSKKEREKRLSDMQSYAKTKNEKRSENVKNYHDIEKKEQDSLKKHYKQNQVAKAGHEDKNLEEAIRRNRHKNRKLDEF